MASYLHFGVQSYKDENGDLHLLYPKTKVGQVDGLEEYIQEIPAIASAEERAARLAEVEKLARSQTGSDGATGELEDTTLEVGSFPNAGAGWNTYKFREAFDAPPRVVLQAENFNGIVQIKDVTAEGFLYCLRVEGSATTASVYTGEGTGTSVGHTATTVVTGVNLSATTATAVVVHYIAIEYGGER